MATRIHIDPDRRFVVFAIESPYTIDEWRAGLEDLLATDVFRETRRVLVDRRAADPPTARFVDDMMRFFASHRADLGICYGAIVVRDEAGFGMGRMTQLKSEFEIPDVSMRAFREYDQAIAWLLGSGND